MSNEFNDMFLLVIDWRGTKVGSSYRALGTLFSPP